MANIVRDKRDGRTGYFVIDEEGRTLGCFSDDLDGLNGAIERVALETSRGKSIVAIACDLPSGFAIFCVIDHDTGDFYFIVAVPGGLLPAQFASFGDAYAAALEAYECTTSPRSSDLQY